MARSLNLSSPRRPFASGPRLPAGDAGTAGMLAFVPEALAAAAVLALASVNLIGQLGVVLFIGGTGALFAWRPLFNLKQLLRFSPLLLLPLLAIVSTIWSDAPQRTMRAALQLLLTIVATIVVCRNLRAERFVLALFAGFVLIVLTVVPGIPASLASGLPLVASLGSKNSVAFAAYMLLALSLAIMADRRQFWPVRLLAVGAVGMALPVEYLAQSGGSTASLLITLLIFPPLAALGLFKLPTRLALIAFTLLILLVASFFLNDIDQAVTAFRTGVLNKDATLTGRTYLWDFAARMSADRPVLGGGYYAFWRVGNIDAEGLWRWGGIPNRSGFNFHNAFVEMRVDLGWVGLSILVATCAIVMGAALVRQVLAPSTALAGLVAITAVNYFRSYVETGLVAPFSLVTLTWLATFIYAVPDGRGTARASPRDQAGDQRPGALLRRERWRPTGPRRFG